MMYQHCLFKLFYVFIYLFFNVLVLSLLIDRNYMFVVAISFQASLRAPQLQGPLPRFPEPLSNQRVSALSLAVTWDMLELFSAHDMLTVQSVTWLHANRIYKWWAQFKEAHNLVLGSCKHIQEFYFVSNFFAHANTLTNVRTHVRAQTRRGFAWTRVAQFTRVRLLVFTVLCVPCVSLVLVASCMSTRCG